MCPGSGSGLFPPSLGGWGLGNQGADGWVVGVVAAGTGEDQPLSRPGADAFAVNARLPSGLGASVAGGAGGICLRKRESSRGAFQHFRLFREVTIQAPETRPSMAQAQPSVGSPQCTGCWHGSSPTVAGAAIGLSRFSCHGKRVGGTREHEQQQQKKYCGSRGVTPLAGPGQSPGTFSVHLLKVLPQPARPGSAF